MLKRTAFIDSPNENHLVIFIIYARIPKSGLIGGSNKTASGILIVYAGGPPGIHTKKTIPLMCLTAGRDQHLRGSYAPLKDRKPKKRT